MMNHQAFSWQESDRYVELFNFEMEVANVIQAKVYDLSQERKVSIIKTLVRQRGAEMYTDSH